MVYWTQNLYLSCLVIFIVVIYLTQGKVYMEYNNIHIDDKKLDAKVLKEYLNALDKVFSGKYSWNKN